MSSAGKVVAFLADAFLWFLGALVGGSAFRHADATLANAKHGKANLSALMPHPLLPTIFAGVGTNAPTPCS